MNAASIGRRSFYGRSRGSGTIGPDDDNHASSTETTAFAVDTHDLDQRSGLLNSGLLWFSPNSHNDPLPSLCPGVSNCNILQHDNAGGGFDED